MKTMVISLVSLLIGLCVGWYAGYTRPFHEGLKYLRTQEDAYESGHAMAASLAVDAIQSIDAGESQKAIQFLSFPIASYYSSYSIYAGTNAERLKVTARIERLAQTNQIVAARIKDFTNFTPNLP
jgi:hypothetical protein